MKVEQIYTGCLAQGAYYIESNGEVAIIDPLREVKPYIDRAKLDGAKIKYIFETHFHADFVSGHVTLSKETGASIVFGPKAETTFKSIIALIGGLRQHFKGYVDWRTAIVFGLPSIIGVIIVRYYVVPALPDVLFVISGFEFTRRMAMFGLFAVLMIPAAFSMIK